MPRSRHIVPAIALTAVLAIPAAVQAQTRTRAPETTVSGPGYEESLDPHYIVFPIIRPLLSRNRGFDRFDARIVRKAPDPSVRSFHLAITIDAPGQRLVQRASSAPADARTGGYVQELDLVPLVGTVRHGRFKSLIPWDYDGFTFVAEIRENGPAGRVVYRYRDPNKVMGISPKGLFDACGGWILTGCLLLLALSTVIEGWLRPRRRRTVLAFAGATLAVLLIMTAGFTRYLALAVAGAAIVAPLVPVAIRGRLVSWGPFAAAWRRAEWRGRIGLLSPALMISAITFWLLAWHESLIVAFLFSPAHFSEFLGLLLGLYFFAGLALAIAVHGLALGVSSRKRFIPVAIVCAGLFFVSGVMRLLDWGTFNYSAGHIDEEFWRLAFYRGNIRFFQTGLAAAAIGILVAATAGFWWLLRLAGRWPLRVAALRSGDDATARTPAVSAAGPFVLNGIAALLLVTVIHGAWLAAWSGPYREISSDVQENFAGVPEVKVIQPLVRVLLAPKPGVPPPLAPALVRKLEDNGVRLSSLTPAYPLMKRSIYLDPLSRAADKPRIAAGTNIIIITVESLSRSLLREDVHGVKGLTPNFDDFRAHGLTFSNLFSADFPTVKGLIATFGSFMFDHRGLSIFADANNPLKSDFLFLSDILHERLGYETIHAQADLGTFGNVEKIFRRHHYDEFYGAESPAVIATQQHPTVKPWGIFDDDLYRFVVSRLKARDRRRPLMMTIAPSDMHFPYATIDHHPGTGGNALLDSVYSTDKAFGIFWDYFKTSPYRDNTLILLTADHAMVTRALRAVDAGMRMSEFDFLTAMLYLPGNERWRGQSTATLCTQLDVAPTILDMMDVDVENPFLGLSIFSERPRYPLAVGREIPPDPVTGAPRDVAGTLGWTPEDHAAFLAYLQALAAANRIRPVDAPAPAATGTAAAAEALK